jgi:PAS domain S-box-containing protein
MADLQGTLAEQANRGISDYFAHLEASLRLLAVDDGVLTVSAAGKRAMERFYFSGGGEYQSITRMGPDGTILYTWPGTASIGTNIRTQPHVQRLLATHEPVLSDVFTSVQGYRSIALHVPVMRGETFDGSLAVLLPIDLIAQRHIAGIRVGAAGYAWAISRDGHEIYCPNPAHIGESALDREGQGQEETDLARAMAQGASGILVLPRDHATGAPKGMQVVFRRISVADSWWSVAVAAPEDEILQRMSGFLQPWTFAVAVAVAGIAGILLLVFRSAVKTGRREARQEAEEAYRSIVQKLPVVNFVVELGPPVRTLYISPQVEQLMGFTAEEWLADPGIALRKIHPEDRERMEESVRPGAVHMGAREHEFRVLKRDGAVRWIQGLSTVTRDGLATVLTGVLRDVTDRKHAEEALREREEQLQQARKLEAVGQLAGGVAHDFNNLLTVIGGYAELLADRRDLPPGARDEINEIVNAGAQARALTDQLLTYSRKQVHRSRVLDTNTEVSRLQGMLRRLIGEHITLATSFAPGVGSVRIDPGQLQQVIMNLAVNARDSMSKGGTLTISTADTVVEAVPVPGRPGLGPGPWVVLAVADTGTGMEPDVLVHIFEPFFTTKGQGRGTGLGLSTVYGIVTQAGGQVYVQSTPGRGSAFEVFLPRAEAAPDAVSAPGTAPRLGGPPGGGKSLRVLLVEDEKLVRVLARSILAGDGHTVQEAADGREALALAAGGDKPFDLLITDVIMPGMGGADLARALTEKNPDLKVIFVSGYAGEALGKQGELSAGVHLVRKPFSRGDLLQMINRVMGEGA